MVVNFRAGQGVKTAIAKPKQDYSGRRRIDIHFTRTTSSGYGSYVDPSSERDRLSLNAMHVFLMSE